MGGKEKVLRLTRVTQSGQEANKKRVVKAAGVRTRGDEKNRLEAKQLADKQEKEEGYAPLVNGWYTSLGIIVEDHSIFFNINIRGTIRIACGLRVLDISCSS